MNSTATPTSSTRAPPAASRGAVSPPRRSTVRGVGYRCGCTEPAPGRPCADDAAGGAVRAAVLRCWGARRLPLPRAGAAVDAARRRPLLNRAERSVLLQDENTMELVRASPACSTCGQPRGCWCCAGQAPLIEVNPGAMPIPELAPLLPEAANAGGAPYVDANGVPFIALAASVRSDDPRRPLQIIAGAYEQRPLCWRTASASRCRPVPVPCWPPRALARK